MRSQPLRLLAATVVAGVLALATALVPSAAMAKRQGADLLLNIYEGLSTSGPVLAQVILTCAPDGGTHPTPLNACDSLRGVDGDFGALPPTGEACPLIYDPVTVEAEGYWYEWEIYYAHTFSNRCEAAVETDHVFLF